MDLDSDTIIELHDRNTTHQTCANESCPSSYPPNPFTDPRLDKALRVTRSSTIRILVLDGARLLNASVIGYSITNMVLIIWKGEGFHFAGIYSMAFSTSICVCINAIAILVIATIVRRVATYCGLCLNYRPPK